jgi:hypothetical protein
MNQGVKALLGGGVATIVHLVHTQRIRNAVGIG